MRFRVLALLAVAFAALTGFAQAAEPLVDSAWIKANIGRPNVVFLDVRFGSDSRQVFERGHIPGAVHSDYGQAGWRKDRDGVPDMLPPLPDLEALIGGLGISNRDHVVVVPAGASSTEMGAATRIYWTFKVIGHDNVSILNGGYNDYKATPGAQIATGPSSRSAASFKATLRSELLATHTEVKVAASNGTPLIDNRPANQYRGEDKHPRADRAGTIPTAVNVPQEKLVDGTGKFADKGTLSRLLQSVGIGNDREQVVFCNTGHWASLGWFVNSELLGNKKTKLYDGSMTEWSKDATTPVVKGERTATAD